VPSTTLRELAPAILNLVVARGVSYTRADVSWEEEALLPFACFFFGRVLGSETWDPPHEHVGPPNERLFTAVRFMRLGWEGE
jgi:hypothetical protein